MHAEIEIKRHEASKKRPTALIALLAILIIAIGGVVFMLISHQNESEAKQKQAAAEKAELEKQARIAEAEAEQLRTQIDELQTQIGAAETRLAQATTDAERQKARDEIAAAKNRLDSLKRSGGGHKKAEDKGPQGVNIPQRCIDDPLAKGCS
jgi:septal ring factor EnvC (AmiA/AmiB activator)